MIFPSFVAFSAQLKGKELYMTCVPDGIKHASRAGDLVFDPIAEVPSLTARFVVERVPNSNDLVHIRSCYNNKYLCRDTGHTLARFPFIIVGGSKPVEVKRAFDCTLFRVKDLGSRIATLTHVQSGVGVSSYPECSLPQCVMLTERQAPLRLKVVDYGLLATLPKRVTLKGDNGQYLWCRNQRPRPFAMTGGFGVKYVDEDSHEYNVFTSNDNSNRSSHYEITHYNGTVRVKSLGFHKFLRRTSDQTSNNSCIWGDSDDTTVNNLDTLFVVENMGDNVIALRNLGNNKVCKRLTDHLLENCLRATETYVVPQARLTVVEPVSRRIIMAEYKLADAKITSQTLEYKRMTEKENRLKDNGDGEIELSVTYSKTRDTKWSKTTTYINNVGAKIEIGLPKFESVKGEITLEGKIEEIKHFEEGPYSSIVDTARCLDKVPPMTKVILKGYVLKATYDVPCSYIQSIKYNTGEEETIVVEDGVCQGFESYGCRFINESIPLS